MFVRVSFCLFCDLKILAVTERHTLLTWYKYYLCQQYVERAILNMTLGISISVYNNLG